MEAASSSGSSSVGTRDGGVLVYNHSLLFLPAHISHASSGYAIEFLPSRLPKQYHANGSMTSVLKSKLSQYPFVPLAPAWPALALALGPLPSAALTLRATLARFTVPVPHVPPRPVFACMQGSTTNPSRCFQCCSHHADDTNNPPYSTTSPDFKTACYFACLRRCIIVLV